MKSRKKTMLFGKERKQERGGELGKPKAAEPGEEEEEDGGARGALIGEA